MPAIVATLSKQDVLCRRFLKSLFRHHPHFPYGDVVVVDDGIDRNFLLGEYPGIVVVEGDSPFSYSRNANKAFDIAMSRGCDLFLCNDDTRFTQSNDVYVMESVASLHGPGLLSPQFTGGVQTPSQRVSFKFDGDTHVECADILCFVAVYIPYATMAKVGRMNSDVFDHKTYGFEDNDYCDRSRMAGLPLMITNRVVMEHGYGERGCSSTYSKLPDLQTMVIRGMVRYEKLKALRNKEAPV